MQMNLKPVKCYHEFSVRMQGPSVDHCNITTFYAYKLDNNNNNNNNKDYIYTGKLVQQNEFAAINQGPVWTS